MVWAGCPHANALLCWGGVDLNQERQNVGKLEAKAPEFCVLELLNSQRLNSGAPLTRSSLCWCLQLPEKLVCNLETGPGETRGVLITLPAAKGWLHRGPRCPAAPSIPGAPSQTNSLAVCAHAAGWWALGGLGKRWGGGTLGWGFPWFHFLALCA